MMKGGSTIICGLLGPVLLAGCAMEGPQLAVQTPQAVLAAAQAESLPLPTVVIPPPVVEPPLPDGERFDLAVTGLPATEFFMGLVEGTIFNMALHPETSGAISLTLVNVTVPEVMETARKVYGYEYERRGDLFLVTPAVLETRLFYVNYLNVRRSGMSQTRVSSGQISDSGGGAGLNPDTGTVQIGGSASGPTSGSQIDTESSADIWSELSQVLTLMVAESPGSSVVVSPQSGLVVVRGMPAELRSVGNYLQASQENLNRQVVLEAKILEVELNDGFQSGINWAVLNEFNGKSVLLGQTGGGSSLANGVSNIAGTAGNLDPNALSQVVGTATSAFGGVFSAAFDLSDFSAFIELLETQGDVHVLSSPRIATVNNQKAIIKVGTDEFFVTDVSNTTVTGTSTTTTPDITLTPFFSGIALDVTPQIDSDNNVILHVHPSVTEVVDQTKSITIGADTQTLPLAFSSVRESDSIVRARSGQVVVIGGLMKERVENDRAATPGLGRLPVIGGLFRQQRQRTLKSELVILLRPLVVEEGVWKAQIEGSSKRMQSFVTAE